MPTRRSTADKLKKPVLYFIVAVILLIGTFYYYKKGETQAPGFADWADPYTVNGLEVHFLDVGQGDCILLLCGDSAVLVDGGEYEYGRDIVNYLKHHGVDKLELLVATHRHSDHIGGLRIVLEKMAIDEVLVNSTAESLDMDSYDYYDFRYFLMTNGATVTIAKNDIVYQFGDLTVEVFSGFDSGNDENDNSVVLRCDYEETTVLLTGDIGDDTEQALLAMQADLDCDLLKVAHHGSKYSTGTEFLAIATPQIAVVSCGEDNNYGHPGDAALQRLENAGCTVYRTDLNGSIIFSCKNKTIELISEGKED